MADHFSFLSFCKIQTDAAIIYIPGVGASDKPVKKVHQKYIYDILDYETMGIIPDTLELINNIRNLYKRRNEDGMKRIKRLESIVDLIISYEAQGRSQIILLGISHGSIIFHLALLRLKTRFLFNPEILKKIILVTVGSPNPPPGMLLHKYEKAEKGAVHYYNFYHRSDIVLNQPIIKLGLKILAKAENPFITQWTFKSKWPFKSKGAVHPKPNGEVDSSGQSGQSGQYPLINHPVDVVNPIIKYNIVKRICMIQHDLGIQFKDVGSHVSHMLAYPFFFKNLYTNSILNGKNINIPLALGTKIDYTQKDTAEYKLMQAICFQGILYGLWYGDSFGGSVVVRHKYIELKKTQKKYIVHVDRKFNKPYIRVSNQRVFLCDIRNTYRYIY